MRIVLQRVARGEVSVNGRSVGRIERGYVLLAGFHREDTPEALEWMAEKIVSLRLFPDPSDASAGERPSSFSRDINEVAGSILVVSQFTLYGDTRKGRRPSFIDAAPPVIAIPLYDRFVELLRERTRGSVETGAFGAMMEVSLVNDGPVTLILER